MKQGTKELAETAHNNVEHIVPKHYALTARAGPFHLSGRNVQFNHVRQIKPDWLQSLNPETQKAFKSIISVFSVVLIFRLFLESRKRAAGLPKNIELLLSFFLRRDEFDAVIGDVNERYCRLLQRHGKRRAAFYAYREVGRSLCPLIKRLLFDTGLIGLLGRWIKKLIA